VIASGAWRGKRFAVLGLARSGAATVRALVARGAEVTAWDGDQTRREAMVDAVTADDAAENISLTVADPEAIDLTGFDGLIVSPGVPINRHPVAARARAAGVPIIGDIELFAEARAELPPHKVVGITGTNGKSTTTALVHHILQTAGVPSLMGGNIGLPILAQAPLPAGSVYVLELSSYQIDLTFTLDCDVAVLLNITPDHLDRYDGFEAYAAAKARLFAMQSPAHKAIISIADDASAKIARSLSARGEALTKIAPGFCMDQSRWPQLQGPHNAANALAAINVCEALGVSNAAIDRGLETFVGLDHRMQTIAVKHGVTYVNDSKATNAESAAPALGSFDRIHWILGGQAKSASLEPCAPHFGHVVRAYAIGEAGPMLADLLKDHVPVQVSGTLAAAVAEAAANARAGETVLLSPACASFDQFTDFEARGRAFVAAVEALA